MSLLETYLARRGALKRLLIARIGSDVEAEDLVQELYFRLERGAHPQQIVNPAAYLYRMALNLAQDHRRERLRTQLRDGDWADSRRVTIGSEAVADEPAADRAYAAKEHLAAVIGALEELSVPCRRVFVMHKFNGLTHAEIAARLGIARSTVEKHMTTALKHLLRRLGRD
jgi:RNA polymerase sigma-70 factor (ECF subfamily)